MAASWIKNGYQAKVWERAKDLAAQRVGQINHPLKWRYAHGIFNKLMASKGQLTEDVIEIDENTDGDGLVNSMFENVVWSKIHDYVSNHPVYKTLPEEELYEDIEGAYGTYFALHNEKTHNDRALLEFVNSYMMAGGTGFYTSGLGIGGTRMERPKGPYIFGVPGTDQGSNGQIDPYGNHHNPEKNIQVVIPDKKSNYKPWETELDTFGNVKSDVERAQHQTDFNTEWNGPMGDLFRHLEELGYDINELNDLTSEEFEDLVIRELKKEAKSKETADMATISQAIQSPKDKMTEIFGYGDVEELDEARKKGSVGQGRDILFHKYNKKEALEKNGRAYVINRFDILKMLSRLGWRYTSGGWIRKPKKSKFTATEPVIEPEKSETPKQQPSDYKPVETKPSSFLAPSEDKAEHKTPSHENDITEPKEDDTEVNPLLDPSVRSKMKEMQARFILAAAHEDKKSSEFVQDEKTEEWKPVIPKEEILAKIQMLKYVWNGDKMLWLNDQMSLPKSMYDMGENAQSVISRSYLAAAKNRFNKIAVGASGKPVISANDANQQMDSQPFDWDSETNKWKWEPEEEKEKVLGEVLQSLNESVLFEAAVDDEDEPALGYDIESIKENQARMIYKLILIGKYAQLAGQKKSFQDLVNSGLVVGEPTNLSRGTNARNEDFYKFTNKFWKSVDPTFKEIQPNEFSSYIRTSDIVKGLKDQGYTFDEDWMKNKKVPAWRAANLAGLLNAVGETEQSFTGRAILSALTKSDEYMNFSPSGATAKPLTDKEDIVSALKSKRASFDWEDGIGWTKINKQDRDTQGNPVSYEIRRKRMQDERALAGYKRANYRTLNDQQKEHYKELAAKEEILKTSTMNPRDWPDGNTPEQKAQLQQLMNNHSKDYKWIPDKNGTANWVHRDKDARPLFTRLKNKIFEPGGTGEKVFDTLSKAATTAFKGGAVAGGALGKILKAISSAHV